MPALERFPRLHLLAVALLAILVGTAGLIPDAEVPVGLPTETSGARAGANADREVADRSSGNAADRGQTAPAEAAAQPRVSAPSAPAGEAPAAEKRTEETVRSGDTLARIFQRRSLSARTLQAVLDSGRLGQRLGRIHPGAELELVTDANGRLVSLSYSSDPSTRLVFERQDDGFEGREVSREPERVLSFRQGTIQSSLFRTSQALGLNDAMTQRLAQIFQWDIDFVLDIRAGDRFALLYEEKYLDGEFIGFGRILAAEFTNRGRHYRAVRYTDSSGKTSYFTPEGDNMRKTFLRAPVEFTRISSNFDPGRLHPIHNRVAPHRGIDYAAPTGTPVMASGDGRVRRASRTGPNGNYITLQHGEQFRTKYLHLSRFAGGIRHGNEVEQGQVIGYVGATGWATGPHLHYEFLVDGVHRNPRTVDLPEADPVPEGELDRFRARTAPLLAMLDSEQRLFQLAERQ